MALLLIDQGEIGRASELYFRMVRQGYLAKSRWFADLYGRSIEGAIKSLSLDEQAAVQEHAKTLNIFTLAFSP